MGVDHPAAALALLAIGAAGLFWGGDKLVAHAALLARRMRVPAHVVGAVVLGFGTSLPELLVSADAALHHDPAIATGNVVGSNICNVGLILGLAALWVPLPVDRRLLRVDLPFMLVASVGLLGLAWDGVIGRLDAVLLLAAFAAYLWSTLRQRDAPLDDAEAVHGSTRRDLLWLLVGLATVAIGARLFVVGAVGFAAWIGVPNEVVGLSVVAVGTSLPELVTSVIAARRGHPDLAVGNVLGSNVFNVLLILGAVGAFGAIPVSGAMRTLDIPVMLGFAVLTIPWRRSTLGRGQGGLLLALYAAYSILLFTASR